MPNVYQINQIVTSITQQALGQSDLEVTDTNFVSVGKEVLSSTTAVDNWYQALVDRIGRTVVSARMYETSRRNLRREPIEWGMALQKISFPLFDAVENPTWYPQTKVASNPFTKTQLKVDQKLFSKMSTWEVDGSIPDVQLKTAFLSPEAMGTFIAGIFTAMSNSLAVQHENVENLCRANMIARKHSQGGMRYVKLLTAYNNLFNTTLTAEEAIVTMEFLRYAAAQIALISDRLTKMSVSYSDGTLPRHTPKDLQCLDVLGEFATNMSYYLQSDTYHNQLVQLPLYDSVAYWQGVGEDDYNFASTSKISVTYNDTPSVTSNAVTATLSNIVAVLYDYEAAGVTIDNERSRSLYNPRDEFTNYYFKSDIGYYVDPSENCVVFALE